MVKTDLKNADISLKCTRLNEMGFERLRSRLN